MKKLVRKLALSCFALGACALTLVSTTYAWWTTNTEVAANGITGTASTAGDASIFISADPATSWAQSVSLTKQITDEGTGTSMIPLQLKDGVLKDIKGTESNNTQYLEFTLYFKTAKLATPTEYVTIYFNNIYQL